MKKVQITFKAYSFRNLDNPFSSKGYKNYNVIVEVRNIPNLDKWRRVNVRDAKLSGNVPEKIEDSLHSQEILFYFQNRGLLIIAEKVTFNPETSNVTITLSDPDLHGLADGGHTYSVIKENVDKLELEKQYVNIEIQQGFAKDEIPFVVEGVNTSNQVKEQSMMEMRGEFDGLRKALSPHLANDIISFSEYEWDEKNQRPKPVSVKEVIAIHTLMNKDLFDETAQPVVAYSSTARCLALFSDHRKTYEKLYPVSQQILELHDAVYLAFGDAFHQAAQREGKKYGQLYKVTGVRPATKKLWFTNKTAKYAIPTAYYYPILSAFRAFLEEHRGKYQWAVDPQDVLKTDLLTKLVGQVRVEAQEHQSPNKTGKSSSLYSNCYAKAETAYVKMVKSAMVV